MESFTYYNPVKLLFGAGQVNNIGKEILPYGKRILLVYGRKHLKESKVLDRIRNILSEGGIESVELPGVHPNPRLALVKEGIELCRKEKVEFILGVGGGSVSDTAKSIAMGVTVDYDIWKAYEDFHRLLHGTKLEVSHIPKRSLPFGVVMTKAGTGSDFDYTSVLTNQETKEKLLITDKDILYAKFTVNDPELTSTLPAEQVSFGVADMMSHYMEQYFTLTPHTAPIDRYIEGALKSVIRDGKKARRAPADQVAQSSLLYSASWGCSEKTVSGSVGGWAAHMIEHELTAITDLNHGHGMAIVFSAWMSYVVEHLPGKFASFAENVWGIERDGRSDLEVAREGIERTREYWRDELGITLTLSEVGIDQAIVKRAAKQAVRFGTLPSIIPLEEKDCLKILESAL